MSSIPLLTVCIVHYRKLKQLRRTVTDLRANTQTPLRIKILNNGYEDAEILAYLRELDAHDNIEVVFGKTNIGCSPGRNLLAQHITTPFIMMLDDDIYVNDGWDIPVMDYFSNHPEVGAIGFSIFRTTGHFWFTGGQRITIRNNVITNTRLALDPASTDTQFIRTDDVSAGAMIYRSSVASIIPWDTAYFIGFEDLEKGIEFKRHDVKCAVSIQSKFIHDKVSEMRREKEYNKVRRNYRALRESYLHFIKKNGVRMDMKRHLFYRYVCLLPYSVINPLQLFWLRYGLR